MKIADKVSLAALTALLGVGVSVMPAMAQDSGEKSTNVALSSHVSDQESSLTSDDVDILESTPEVPDSVKEIVKRLNHATKDVTLEDLNSAREAVVKLDVLIDIEKRLNDLITLRKEREETEDELTAAIPDSAFPADPSVAPMAVQPVQPVVAHDPVAPMPSSLPDVEVLRVTGASGRYVALIKELDGTEVQVRVGDELSDGSIIKTISRHGVTLKGGKKSQIVKVKDAGAFFVGK